jgi:putative methyltransferase (TIGR04325 family)
MSKKNYIIWEGVYKKKPNNIDFETNYFHTNKWLDKSIKRTNNYLLLKDQNYFIDNHLDSFCCGLQKKIKILDFGGGIGDIVFYTKNLFHNSEIIIYEPNKKITIEGKKIFNRFKKLKFVNDISKIKKSEIIDIVYLGSVLQYIFDLDNFLNLLSKLNFKYLFLYDVMADKNPNFYSKQFFYGKKMTVKFYNLKYLFKMFDKYKLKKIFITNIKRNIRNEITQPMMSNFKKNYRIRYAKTIILQSQKK